jgi:hypothetical protein
VTGRVADDWGLWVNETGIFASGIGADRWISFTLRAKERLTLLWAGPDGGEWHVTCTTREAAQEARDIFLEAGFHRNHVRVAQLSACQAKVAKMQQRVIARFAAMDAPRAQLDELDEAWSWWVAEVMPDRATDRQAMQDAYWAIVRAGGKAEALRLYREHVARQQEPVQLALFGAAS